MALEELSTEIGVGECPEMTQQVKLSDEELKEEIARVSAISSRLKTKMLLGYPFFGHVLTRLCALQADMKTRTASTDSRDIFYNPKFTYGKSLEQINFLLLHEMYHVLLEHKKRFENFVGNDHELFNEACDDIINWEILHRAKEFHDEAGVDVEFIEGGCLLYDDNGKLVDLSDENAESLYNKLLKEKENNPPSDQSSDGNSSGGADDSGDGGSGNSSGDDDSNDTSAQNASGFSNGDQDGGEGDSAAGGDTKQYGKYTQSGSTDSDLSQNSIIESIGDQMAVSNEIERIYAEARAQGFSPTGGGCLKHAMDKKLTKSKIRWDKLLRRWLTDKITDEYSYDSPNKKYMPHELIMPGPGAFAASMGTVYCLIDTSGSISEDELDVIINNAWTICDNYEAELVVVLWHTEVYSVIKDLDRDCAAKVLSKLKVASGGTSPECVYDWLKDNRKMTKEAMCFLWFTDGYFTVPKDISVMVRRKSMIALPNTREYDKELENMGTIVSYHEED